MRESIAAPIAPPIAAPMAGAFAAQARACADLGSPFSARLLAGLPARLDPDTAFGARLLGRAGDPGADALPLRAAGALHALARSGRDPALTAAWPPDPAQDPAEVARSTALLGGLLTVAAGAGLPVELLEIGASAGLLGLLDRYRHALGEGRALGDPASPVLVESLWRGPPPPLDAPLRVVARAGADIRPPDPVTRPRARRSAVRRPRASRAC